MSRISTSAVSSVAEARALRRPDVRRTSERLAWFVAAYVIVSVVAMTVAGDLRGSFLTSPQSHLASAADATFANVQGLD
jgi:hypothetical protein